MDTIIASIIGGIATIASGIFGAKLQARRDRQHTERVEVAVETSGRQQVEAAKTAYGLVVREFRSSGRFYRDECLHTRRELNDVRVTGSATFMEIPATSRFRGPDAALLAEPQLTSYSFVRAVELKTVKLTETNRRFALVIEGGLSRSDPNLTAIIEQQFHGQYAMTTEQRRQAYGQDDFKYPYYVEDIYLPVEQLVVEVEFPYPPRAQPFPVAFFGHSEVIHRPEARRLADSFSVLTTGARLFVPEPVFGFRYGIAWDPPDPE